MLGALGVGIITGAADDDPSAIGTFAAAGAKLGPAFLWTAPATFPMMATAVYLSSKLGQVTGKGLFAAIRDHYPRWFLYSALVAVLIGNTVEAAADLGGIAAGINVLAPIPIPLIAVFTAMAILAVQIWGSYTQIKKIFQWLALTLLAYVGAAILAKPDLREVIRGTLIPSIRFNKEFLALLVAIIGATLSPYLYTWQSNAEVEEKVAIGRRRLSARRDGMERGATAEDIKRSRRDVVLGMLFSNVVMYFIMLSTASTLFKAGKAEIDTAAEAAQALRPLAGNAAGILFAFGIVGAGVLAVPIMTIGAAYDFSQAFGLKTGLSLKLSEAKGFYAVMVIDTLVAVAMNFSAINPMKALVLAGIVQGFSTPPLLMLILLMTNNRAIMGDRVNGRALNVLGWITTAVLLIATIGLIVVSIG